MTRDRSAVSRDVLGLLSKLDPYGLRPGSPDGFPADEYDSEAQPLAAILLQEGEITVEQVDEIWLHWFGESLCGVAGREAADRFVFGLNRLVP